MIDFNQKLEGLVYDGQIISPVQPESGEAFTPISMVTVGRKTFSEWQDDFKANPKYRIASAGDVYQHMKYIVWSKNDKLQEAFYNALDEVIVTSTFVTKNDKLTLVNPTYPNIGFEKVISFESKNWEGGPISEFARLPKNAGIDFLQYAFETTDEADAIIKTVSAATGTDANMIIINPGTGHVASPVTFTRSGNPFLIGIDSMVPGRRGIAFGVKNK